jgi:hypothetical protein
MLRLTKDISQTDRENRIQSVLNDVKKNFYFISNLYFSYNIAKFNKM